MQRLETLCNLGGGGATIWQWHKTFLRDTVSFERSKNTVVEMKLRKVHNPLSKSLTCFFLNQSLNASVSLRNKIKCFTFFSSSSLHSMISGS